MWNPDRSILYGGDNLDALKDLRQQGAKFDLVELDGPYMAGLEDWDTLTEAQYIEHYAERLAVVRDILQPWGVVFVFGYPEGCAEIKSWVHRTETLYLRRWLTWYKQVTAHKGRKVEAILLFWKDTPSAAAAAAFGKFLKGKRQDRRWTLRHVGELADRQWWHRGGNLFYENGNGGFPSLDDMLTLGDIFDFSLEDWPGVFYENFPSLTDIDFISKAYSEDTERINSNGLRSKPIGLYLDLFKPTIPPTEHHNALILYGGSGNAAIAAAALGYDVVVCEQNNERRQAIQKRLVTDIYKWERFVENEQPPLFVMEHQQLAMEGLDK